MEHVLVIGGGIGSAIAHDLTLRGFRVTLLEKGELLCGATGRHHGLLHSGARYVLHDIATARECIQENKILRRIVPAALEQNDGLFVALDDADMDWLQPFLEGCRTAGIPVEVLSAARALQLEPRLTNDLKAAVRVPDAVMDAWRLPLHFFAAAKAGGAAIRPFNEVVAIRVQDRTAVGVVALDHCTHREYTVTADLIVNAAGAWAGKIAALVGVEIPVRPVPGVMVGVPARLTDMVINRLHPAGDGDIIVPQRKLSLLGTSAWLAQDPDRIDLPRQHVREMIELCARMVPQIRKLPVHSAWSAARPLIVEDPDQPPTRIPRTFDCVDHADRDNLEGFVSVLGGKATTMRAMAEKTVDLVCAKTGRAVPCSTRHTPLPPYRTYFHTNRSARRRRALRQRGQTL
ncbi:MAG TPA: FAD-dependent oxidoreductase [Desulfobacterales bacterium]